MAQIDTVVPNSLNYTDIKPQAIENKIQLCRYQPTVTINGVRGGEMVKFLISGNGFLDPYSTYFQFRITCPFGDTKEIRTLDRSAHSFISRMVIRSQGVELERIENYDVIAAMINDMLYSPEQCTQHYWEGFPSNSKAVSSLRLDGVVDAGGGTELNEKLNYGVPIRAELLTWLCQGGSPSIFSYIGECAFHNIDKFTNTQEQKDDKIAYENITENYAQDNAYFPDFTRYAELAGNYPMFPADGALPGNITMQIKDVTSDLCPVFAVTYAYHQNGKRIPSSLSMNGSSAVVNVANQQSMQFIIPIYSGIIGLLMPEKKLLPLSLLPLDIEVVFNKHALYSSLSTGSRDYIVNEFFLYGNTLFFESDIHKTLEASVADHGLFIYCNSFHSAPVQIIQTNQVPSTMQISMNLKSINSVHWVFLYNYYDRKPCARKLHFVSHNLTRLQLLNGTTLIPQYPIEGNMGTSKNGEHIQFIIELYKAWNRMHDPAMDNALNSYNLCGDDYVGQFDPIYKYGAPQSKSGITWSCRKAPEEGVSLESEIACEQFAMQTANKQALVGRCQYGISLEGEELGSDRTMITGRKSQYPFQIQLASVDKFSPFTSHMFTFLRADFIVYIRPDLQIVTLGK